MIEMFRASCKIINFGSNYLAIVRLYTEKNTKRHIFWKMYLLQAEVWQALSVPFV